MKKPNKYVPDIFKEMDENPYKLINRLVGQNGFANYQDAMKQLGEQYKKIDPTTIKIKE